MASKRDRQRKLERARVERRIARQAHRVRRKRQIRAAVGASLTVVLIAVGLTWLLGGFDPEPETKPTVASGTCTWHLKDPADGGGIFDTGHPPTTGEVRTGTETLTIETNLGVIEATIDLAKAPCTAASIGYLGEKEFYVDSRCHRLDTAAKLLQCGDTTGNGSGAPSYTFADEYLPTEPIGAASPSPTASPSAEASPGPATYYAKGTIVMANDGPNTNAGQLAFVYGDGSTLPPTYSIVGTVTKGLSIIEEIAGAGVRDDGSGAEAAGNPAKDLIFQRVYLGTPLGATPSPSTPPATGTPSPETTGT